MDGYRPPVKAVVDTNIVAYLLLGTEGFAQEAKACFNTVSHPVAPAHWEAELTHTTRDGRQIVVESRQVLVQEAVGRRLVLETNRDITARKHAEQALAAERERLLVTLSSGPLLR